MTTEKLIFHDKKYAGSSNTVLIIWQVSKEDEGFYQASISQNNKTYISNSIELQVAEGKAFFNSFIADDVKLERQRQPLKQYDLKLRL